MCERMIKKIFILFIYLSPWVYAQQAIRFMVVGDTHYYSPSSNFKESILYEITLAAIKEKVDFIFFTGDLILMDYPEDSNTDSLLSDWKFVLDTLYFVGTKVYACRGNNDIGSQITWNKLFSGPYALPNNGPKDEKYYTYSFEFDNFLFISLDQYTQYEQVNQVWLDEQLHSRNKPYIFIASHEPAFKVFHSGLSVFPDERNIFWRSLTNNKGKIYFCGHDHFYDHSIIYDDDDNPYNEVHQIIVGTGGGGIHPDSEYNGDNGFWHPVRIFHDSTYGYVLAEVDNFHLKTTWKHRIDRFTFSDGGDNYNYIITSVKSMNNDPDEFSLSQNFPNPFNPKTCILYTIDNSLTGTDRQLVTLKVYNILGEMIKTLVDEYKPAGKYETEFYAEGLTSGIYFYRLKAGSSYAVRKMIFLK